MGVAAPTFPRQLEFYNFFGVTRDLVQQLSEEKPLFTVFSQKIGIFPLLIWVLEQAALWSQICRVRWIV